MRTKQIIKGLKNSQRIRVILDGIGFYTTVQGATELPFTNQRTAAWCALEGLAKEKNSTCFGTQVSVYNYKMQRSVIDVQVDLV